MPSGKNIKKSKSASISKRKKDSDRIILVTNDDGVTAPGLRNLAETMRQFGKVVIVAPDGPQSGMGHAITINKPLRLDKVNLFEGIEAWQCSGTPVDCVKLAVNKILHRKPDLCVSGINHGSNSSINVIYSGTMSAAMEGAIEGIPSVGFSLLNYSHQADFATSRKVVEVVIQNVLQLGIPEDALLNVNIPDLPLSKLKGIKICRQARAKWEEEFDERKDPTQRSYYWLTGKFINLDSGDDTDEKALSKGFASVVPVQFDFTAHHTIQHFNSIDWHVA